MKNTRESGFQVLSLWGLQGGGKVMEALQAAQQEAYKGRRGLWEYGDPGDDSEDEAPRHRGRFG